jgi:predicted dehydrogenase
MSPNTYTRRRFVAAAGAAVAGSLLVNPALTLRAGERETERMKVALVGTGVRGVSMFGRELLRDYADSVDLVGICDSNPGRLKYAESYIRAGNPDRAAFRSFGSLGEMLDQTKPQWLVVTSWDWEHHNHIIEGMKRGCDIICEKPITIDEKKAQMILDAERRYNKKVIVTLNYRYAPHRAKLKELLMEDTIGEITTVDFHWNVDHPHLQRYMQRWHGESDKGGTLWVHKCTHHFDLINWWIDSDPVEVFAYADLERFGARGPFRGNNCRDCSFTDRCDYYWDITKNEHLKGLYTDNEHYDGYIRDNCVFRENIDIFDKHAALIRYANNAYLNYSLTADTDYDGYWIAFNGTKGRIEGREAGWPAHRDYHEWVVTPRNREPRVVRVPFEEGGHWGGDRVLMNRLFRDPQTPDPLGQSASTRDGIMSILVGIAARRSAVSGKPERIEGLTDLTPAVRRP